MKEDFRGSNFFQSIARENYNFSLILISIFLHAELILKIPFFHSFEMLKCMDVEFMTACRIE